MKGIRSYLNFLERNKAYTAVNLFGFAIALMFVLVVGVYVYQELSLDHFHEDADRIVVQCTDSEEIDGNRVWMVGDALPVAYWLKDLVPDVEEVSPVVSMDPETRIKSGEKELRARLGFVESNFFTFFSFPLLSGSPEGVLQDEFSAVVSESFARRVFGHLDVAGQSLRISDSTQVTISGLMADMERTALPCFDVVIRLERATEFNPGVSRTSANVAGYAITCLKMRPGSDMNVWRETVLEFFKKNYWVYEDYCTDVKYLPLWDAYFQTESEDEGEGFRTGNRLFVDVLLAVVVLILAFAIFNYVNLGMAQTGFRAREVATRRLLGASRGAVIRRLAGEAVALTLIAYLLAVLLAFAVKTGAENLLQSPLDFSILYSVPGICLELVLVLAVGLLAGILPAIQISAFRPVDVVKGGFVRYSRQRIGKVFMILQYAVTMFLLSAALVMFLQIRHLLHTPLGYDKENILNIIMFDYRDKNTCQRVYDALGRLSCVKSLGKSMGTPFDGGNNNSWEQDGRLVSMQILHMDSTAFRMLGLKKLRDNHLVSTREGSLGGGWYLTRNALPKLGIEEDSPSFLMSGKREPVAGILADIRRGNILTLDEWSAFMVSIWPESSLQWFWNLLVEIQGDPVRAYEEIGKVFREVTGQEMQARFIDQQVQDSFATQLRLLKIVALFAGVALVISVMGLVAMSMYFIRQRTKEVAIRKVFGSESGAVMGRLVWTFLWYGVVGFVIALPLSWVAMEHWLSAYSYRIAFSPLYVLAAGLACALVSFLSVFWQSYRAAHADPTRGLRQE